MKFIGYQEMYSEKEILQWSECIQLMADFLLIKVEVFKPDMVPSTGNRYIISVVMAKSFSMP
jgi:hypothetical protein